MNRDKKYSQYAIVHEMLQMPDILRNFKLKNAEQVIDAIR